MEDPTTRQSITEELPSHHTQVTERSEFKLDLHERDDDRLPLVTPRSARESRMDTARSIEEIPEEYTVPTETSEHNSPRLDHLNCVESPREALSSIYTDSHQSEVYSSSYTTSEKSKTDDYSDHSTTTASTASAKSLIQSERSAGQSSRPLGETRSPIDEDDISEIISEIHSEEESKSSEPMFDITAELPAVTVSDPLQDMNIGDRVSANNKPGTLRFKGFVKFMPGFVAGVELDDAEGDTDGTVEGVTYFTCKELHGILLPALEVSELTAEMDEERLMSAPLTAQIDEARLMSAAAQDALDKHTEKVSGGGLEVVVEDDAVRTLVLISDAEGSVEDDLDEVISHVEPEVISDDDDRYAKPKSLSEELIEAEQNKKQTSENANNRYDEKTSENANNRYDEKVTEMAVQNLVNDAISQMMNIRTKKRTVSQESDTEDDEVRTQEVDKQSDRVIEEIERPQSPLGYRKEDNFNQETEPEVITLLPLVTK